MSTIYAHTDAMGARIAIEKATGPGGSGFLVMIDDPTDDNQYEQRSVYLPLAVLAAMGATATTAAIYAGEMDAGRLVAHHDDDGTAPRRKR